MRLKFPATVTLSSPQSMERIQALQAYIPASIARLLSLPVVTALVVLAFSVLVRTMFFKAKWKPQGKVSLGLEPD